MTSGRGEAGVHRNTVHKYIIAFSFNMQQTKCPSSLMQSYDTASASGSNPGDSDREESACNVGDPEFYPWVGKIPGEGNGYPPQYSCLETSMDREALVRYSPWNHKESDTTE